MLGCGGDPAAAARSASDLVHRYAEPHRTYHNIEHVLAVLTDSAALAGDIGLEDFTALRLAACAHDVVYNGLPGEDERASADWAREHLAAAGVPSEIVDRVAALILATVEHDAGDDVVCQVLMDADLAILAADAEAYGSYAQAVRREYARVPDEMWRLGRSSVLLGFLDKDRIYRTDAARQRWEAAARTNLRRELEMLNG